MSDLISRQAVLESLKTDYSLILFDSYGNLTFAGEHIIEAIKRVPSVEPEKCSDLISRQGLLNAIFQREYGHDYDENTDILNLKYVDIIKRMPSIEPETCGDLISRQAAIGLKTIAPIAPVMDGEDVHYEEVVFVHDLERIPSVESERKPGKWVHMVGWWECNQCHAEYTDMPTCMGKVIYEYCPMCGAKMEVDNG